ncbi:hypothetical protein GGI07_005321 [Coemansia sp. Benny D115]|nr:hypothetical protein GGI07_005321 [Coemansia sp. Benny D115]
MYLVALKMMAAPNVVVMYIGDCKDLCVSDIEYEQYKYVQFIEHIACAFCEYTFVKTLADIWYIDTSMGTNYKAMKTATSKLLDQIKQMCREQKVTLVAFFDNYEAIVGVASFDLIASAFDFAYKYEAVVVTSYSDAMGMDANTIAHMHQCVLPIPLNHEEAMNMSIVTHGHVDISDDSLKRIFEAADYHPIDIVRTLSLYENRGAALYDYDDAAEDRLAGIDSVQRAINDHCLSRGIRLADMHMRFFSKELEVAASQMDSKSIVRSPEANNVINTDTPEFDTAKRGIMSTVFYLYHGFEPKHGSVRDPQFLVTECNARSDGPRCDYDTQKPQATKDICRPAAAIDAMYNIHFHGTVHEQFSWLLGKINFKLELEPHIRARYFDLCLLETGNLDVVTKDIFGKDTQITAMRFTEITGHNYLAYKVGDPRKCTTFDDAIEYIDAYTKASKESPPRIKPYAAHAQELRYSVVIYFQNLGFSGSWISQSTASCASFQGSFMAAVTRVDLFQPAASSSVASTYSGCEFEIVWIVSDPLKVITNHSLPSASMSGAAAVSSSRVKTKSSSADSVAGHYSPDIDPDNDNDNDEDSSYRPPRENIDYDTVPGAHHSWTARAIDLFPDIKRRCQAAISDANIASVRMLTLTADTRVDKLSTAESLQNMSSLASLRESQNSQSRDIRVAKTSSLSFYKNISVYF